MRRPWWMKGQRTKSLMALIPSRQPQSTRNLIGIVLCLLGAGVMLAALPGWMYLLFLGAGILALGLFTLQR